jgi:DHA2 family multidrug resistance protein
VATLMNVNSHQNYLDLTTKISLLNQKTSSVYYGFLHSLQAKLPSVTGMLKGDLGVLKIFEMKIQAQVFMLSFNQLIWTMMIIMALSFIPLYFLQLKRKVKMVDAH